MKSIKYLISLLFVSIVLCIPIKANAEITETKLGDQITGYYNSDTQTLTVSGTGKTYDYTYYTAPYFDNNTIYKIVINEGITEIGQYTFTGIEHGKDIVLPNSLVKISDHAFAHCGIYLDMDRYTTLTIPKNVTYIGKGAFNSCHFDKLVFKTNKITKISDNAFSTTQIRSLTLPNSIKEIGKYAFWNCNLLKKVTIPKNVKKIGQGAFSTTLTTKFVIKSKKITKIGEDAFWSSGWEDRGVYENKKHNTKKITVIVPKSKLKKYTKLLNKSKSYLSKRFKLKYVVKTK